MKMEEAKKRMKIKMKKQKKIKERYDKGIDNPIVVEIRNM